MKKIHYDKIINIDKNKFDNKFLLEYLDINFKKNPKINLEIDWENFSWYKNNNVLIFYIEELLEKYKNEELYNNLNWKFAIYSEVYSPKDELKIFEKLFFYAISNNKKIHVIWITLKEELEILESYYKKEWFLRDDVNCFIVDFSKTLVSVSVNIENLIWRWSDYKAYKKDIFFVPPIRESGQNKAIFKWINRWSIASIYIKNFSEKEKDFLEKVVREEKILPLTLAKVLNYNLSSIFLASEKKELVISY